MEAVISTISFFITVVSSSVYPDLEKTRANYEDVRARIAEHRSRIAQAADAKRGLDALAAQMCNLASVARSLDPNIEMTEHIQLLLDCLHLGNPPDDLKYVPATIPLELVVAATASFDQAVPMKGKKRTRAEAAGLGFAHLVPHGSVPDGITEADVAIFDAILSKKESSFRSALLPLCDRKLILGEACARCSRLSPCLAVLSDKPRKLNARTMTQTCVSCQVLHVSCGTVGCDYFPGTKRFLRIWNHRVELGEHPMPEAVLQAIDLIARGEGEDVKPVSSKGKRKNVVEDSDDEEEGEVRARRPITGSSRVAASTSSAAAGPSSSKLSPPKPSSSGGTVPAAGSSRVDPRASLPPKSRVPASLTTLYEQLTPMDRNERHLSVPDALEPGQILRFAMPPDDVPEEDAANVFAERGQAIYEWYCVMNRINAYLAGEKFINRLIRESDPLRYDCVNEPTLSPAVHSPLYPVPVPELRGNASWRALLRASADQFPPVLQMAKSQIGRDDLDLLAKGLCRVPPSDLEGWNPVDIYRWVRCEGFSYEKLADGGGVVPVVSSWLAQRVAAREVAVPRWPGPVATRALADSAPRTEKALPELFPRESRAFQPGALSVPPPARRSSAPPPSRTATSSSGPAPPVLTEEDMDSLIDHGPSSAPASRVFKREVPDTDAEMESAVGKVPRSSGFFGSAPRSSGIRGSSSSPPPHLRLEDKMDVDQGGVGGASGSG
ncbi:hypothetical protein C8R47DRAFT_1231089 [Mycena vitilis]|nr:hypothetical protein C8R47DRAFT_1231089 [Mycena vitilis]